MNPIAAGVFLALFAGVSGLGFYAARWRRGDLAQLHEWGLGGRRFGTFVTWFLLGGDLYTAYTFIAVPALIYGAGAVGFFAVPYTILVYPILYVVFPRLWSEARAAGHVTAADIVGARHGDRWLALAVALTGILATMPYIALQLVGMEVVIGALGLQAPGLLGDLPLIIAFLVLAVFTYSSGLRAPALIAVVKDALIYVTVLTALVVVPARLGGFAAVFAHVPAGKLLLAAPLAHRPTGFDFGAYSGYGSLALGSAMALFLYPHSITGILSASSAGVIRRNAAILPAYSLVLGLLALLGFMALAMGVGGMPQFAAGFARFGNNFAVPALLLASLPPWFVGLAFAAIAIGALVPAAIMSIATANTFTRNVWRAVLRPGCGEAEEAGVAKLVSLVVKFGALIFVLALPLQYAIQLQLLGGIWMIQIGPALLLRRSDCDARALLAGWAAGMASGTWMAASLGFKSSIYPLHLFGSVIPGYAAVYALIVNLLVVAALALRRRPLAAGAPPS